MESEGLRVVDKKAHLYVAFSKRNLEMSCIGS